MVQPLAVESNAPEELRVESRQEVTGYLQELHREQSRVLLSSPDGFALQTRICAFSPEADLLGFEIGIDPDGQSEQLVREGEITGVAFIGSVKLQFELESPVIVLGEHGAVLRSALPTRLYRFQRRQAFRVQPLSSAYPRVLWPQKDGSHAAARVCDVSVGGVGLQLLPEHMLGGVGELRDALTLELDRTTQLPIQLCVQHIELGHLDGQAHRHVGCAFTELDPAVARALQVYVDQTQKRRRLLRVEP